MRAEIIYDTISLDVYKRQMDLENQNRVKEFADEYGAENLVVVLGAAEGLSLIHI